MSDINFTFLHYGIKDSDMATISQICAESGVDYEWLKDYILKEYHRKYTERDLSEARIKTIITKALNNLPS